MLKLLEVWLSPSYEDKFEAHLLCAARCMDVFCFMMSGEFTTTQGSESPSILFSGIAVDWHSNPTMIRVFLRHWKNDSFSKEIIMFWGKLRITLKAAHVDPDGCSGHSFWIGAAKTAALAGIPVHVIKMLGRWESEAYQLYILTPRGMLATIAQTITQ